MLGQQLSFAPSLQADGYVKEGSAAKRRRTISGTIGNRNIGETREIDDSMNDFGSNPALLFQ